MTKTGLISLSSREGLSFFLTLALLTLVGSASYAAPLDVDFVKAAERGDLAEMKTLLDKGVDINGLGYGETALTTAIFAHRPEVVKFLLEKGADPNMKGQEGGTPIQTAFHSFARKDYSFLFYTLAYQNVACNVGKLSPIQAPEAFDERQAAILKLLINSGADANTIVAHCTVLMWAAIHGQIDLVKLLLQKGADVNLKFKHGSPALLWGAIGGHKDVISLLKRHGAVTTLHEAAMIGDKGEVQRFLKAGAGINGRNECGWTPLMGAAWGGNAETIRILLANGADVNLRGAHGETAFMVAAWRGNLEGAQILLKNGAKIDEADKYGRTPLIDAASHGNCPVAKLLLDNRADIDAKDDFGKTAFMKAVEMGRVKVAKLLLENGADLKAVESDGWSAVATALNRRDAEMMKLLCQYGAKITLPIAAMIGDIPEVQRHLASGANINATDEVGQTPLLWAAAMGHAGVVKLILEKGGSVNARDQNGWTALIGAARNQHTETMKSLLDGGAFIDSATPNGWTALMWVSQNGKADAVTLLVDRGADLNLTDWEGQTALNMAHGNAQILAILRSHGASGRETDKRKRGSQCGEEWDYEDLEIATGAPAPMERNQTIRMDSQEVVMRLTKDSFIVDAVFRFFNTGETRTEWVGFPKRGNACRDGRLLSPAFMRFDTWIDGRKMEFADDRGVLRRVTDLFSPDASSQPMCGAAGKNSYNRWLTKYVTFPGHSLTTIRLSFEDSYVSGGSPPWEKGLHIGVSGAGYIVGTSTCWKGGVKKFAFTVDASSIGGIKRLGGGPAVVDGLRKISEDSVRYEVRDYEPKRNEGELGASVRW